ncbi:MAG: methyltransferase domain-containing protein [Simkaniaceae bacterium]|nr:methyltransferase domain-containing protein [Simkaniaceae bacterium]
MKEILPELADVIFCTEVLEHLQHPESAITHLLTLKKDAGVLILTVPNGRIDSSAQHINFWSPESWKIFLQKSAPSNNIQSLKTLSPNAPGGYNLCAIIGDSF